MRLRDTCYVLVFGLLPGMAAAQAGPTVTVGAMTLTPQSELLEPIEPETQAPRVSLRPPSRPEWAMPDMMWDGHPRGARWSLAVMGALRGHGAGLMDVVPEDIEAWCPAYEAADRAQRAAFWAGLTSTLAFHESTHRPRAVGGGGRWFGLVQIAPGTARWRNCEVRSGQALLDGAANLRCGIRIMAITVPRDGVVSEGMRGVAADWGPFHSRRKREEMRNWVRQQDYCRPPTRPQIRPVGLVPEPVLPVPRPEPFADLAEAG